MNTLTVKIPSRLERELAALSERAHMTRSEIVRQAIQQYLQARAEGVGLPSALDQAGDLVGCFAGGPADLSSNRAHLDGFGRV
jgi:Arc/MetJ-type ribon-helix-helix transcriptional regulator